MKNIVGIVISLIYIGLVMVAGKFFEKAGKEASRKFIHIMLANWWIIAMCFFDNVYWACSLPLCFILVNYLSYKKNLISVIERDSKEEGLGTVYYAITLFFLAISICFSLISASPDNTNNFTPDSTAYSITL